MGLLAYVIKSVTGLHNAEANGVEKFMNVRFFAGRMQATPH